MAKIGSMSGERLTNEEFENVLNTSLSSDVPWEVTSLIGELFERVKMLEQQMADLQAE